MAELDSYVVRKNGDAVTIDFKRDHDPSMGDRLLKMEESFESLRPRAQARVLWARRFRRALRASQTSQQELGRIIGTPPSSISSWANAVSMPGPDVMDKLSKYFGEDVTMWTVPEETKEAPAWKTSVVTDPPLVLSEDEEALIRRVRRMSEEERDALFTLLHVLR